MQINELSVGFVVYLGIVTFLFGLVFGSFCNAWAWRICHHEKISRGRSHCPVCQHVLGAKDLVPLFSWLLLKGKCRYCGTKISKRYPIAELLLGGYFVTIIMTKGIFVDTARLLLMGIFLFVAALVDYESMELPDGLLIAVAIVSLLRLVTDISAWKSMLIGFFAVSVPLLLVVLLADKVLGKETMGGGDIKLIAVLGLHFGALQTLLLLIFGCIIGLVAAMIAKKGTGKPFPFGPSLVAAAWLTALIGEPIVRWYVSLF